MIHILVETFILLINAHRNIVIKTVYLFIFRNCVRGTTILVKQLKTIFYCDKYDAMYYVSND